MYRLIGLVALLLIGVSEGRSQTPAEAEKARPVADEKVSAEGAKFFEQKIRPALVKECYACHSSENGQKVRGGLAINTRTGLREGGDSGAVIVPGDPANSLLIQAINHVNPELAMPPKKKLDAAVIKDLEEWVRMGAPDPRQDAVVNVANQDLERGRSHWAFLPLKKVTVPNTRDDSWPRTDVDRYVLAALEEKGLNPNRDANRVTLIRRLAFDLTGLPPATQDLDTLAADLSPQGVESLVDRLLQSPQFGERWARHWLDVARYAETTGKTVNFYYPQAWRYRDYVIASFNADKPYDQFIKEQLAGDLMPTDDPHVQSERMIATGFLAIGPKVLNERSGLKFELDVADEQIDVTTQAFLGITVACARCHDHKFDPIPQLDYYALAGIFRSTETCCGTVSFINAQRTSPLLPLPAAAQPAVALAKLTDRERSRIEEQIRGVRASMQNMRDPIQQFFSSGQVSLLQARLDAYDAKGEPKLLAMGVRDKPAGPGFGLRRGRFGGFAGFTFDGTRTIGDSPVYTRGESDQPSAAKVPRGTLQVVSHEPLKIPANTSGRLELAEWIASKQNPLTARVMVNRIWRQLFGRGLVPTADDFGMAGRPPTHPELLDHLAQRLMDDGWSIKRFIKYLVLSHVYQLDSTETVRSMEVDPDNQFLWRMTPRRLDAECLRDTMLAVSGQLDLKAPVGSVIAQAGEGPATRVRFGPDPVASAINDPRNIHRSIYLPIVRDNLPESMALFDAANPSLITVDRPQTTVPSQSLYLLNNEFVLRASDAAADQLLVQKDEPARIEAAFVRYYGRKPTAEQQERAARFLTDYRDKRQQDAGSRTSADHEVWSAFCQALFASAEFQYRR